MSIIVKHLVKLVANQPFQKYTRFIVPLHTRVPPEPARSSHHITEYNSSPMGSTALRDDDGVVCPGVRHVCGSSQSILWLRRRTSHSDTQYAPTFQLSPLMLSLGSLHVPVHSFFGSKRCVANDSLKHTSVRKSSSHLTFQKHSFPDQKHRLT